jgi:hypothetical protein
VCCFTLPGRASVAAGVAPVACGAVQTRGTVCHGLTEVAVDTPEQVMALLADAEKRCRVSETKMNKQSKWVRTGRGGG